MFCCEVCGGLSSKVLRNTSGGVMEQDQGGTHVKLDCRNTGIDTSDDLLGNAIQFMSIEHIVKNH